VPIGGGKKSTMGTARRMKCPVCSTETWKPLGEIWGAYQMCHCVSCDVVFSNPMVGPGREWYEKNEEGVIYKLHEDFESQLGWNHEQFLNEDIQAKTLLDVGCGRGRFLNEARRIGYIVTGIDFDRINVEVARRRFGISEIQSDTLEKFVLKNPRKRFDVITFFEVLEHLPDPRQFLRTVRSLLNPGGYIALSVPNRERFINTIGYLDKPPYHLTRWTKKALGNILQLTDFSVLHLKIKPLRGEDLIDIIRLGVGRRLIRVAIDRTQKGLISWAVRLYQLKRQLLRTVMSPIAWGLRAGGCQGAGLYCLAKIGD